MLTPLLIMVREGFEAALIVAILAVYLRRIDRLDLRRQMWQGIGAAIAIAAVAGVILDQAIGGLTGRSRLRAFAAISIFAAVVLTWMIFWMRRHARSISGDLRTKIDHAIATGENRVKLAVFGVAFIAVLREGLEAALFLVATTTTASGAKVVTGALIGIAIAVGLGVMVNVFGRQLPMKQFFLVTGMVIVIFAAGLLARTVAYLQTSGDMGTAWNNVYDLTQYRWLTTRSQVGQFLGALFGWDPRPSIEQVAVWLLYLVPVSFLFLAGGKSKPAAAAAPAPEKVSA
jgi:high-affinity iron transporter